MRIGTCLPIIGEALLRVILGKRGRIVAVTPFENSVGEIVLRLFLQFIAPSSQAMPSSQARMPGRACLISVDARQEMSVKMLLAKDSPPQKSPPAATDVTISEESVGIETTGSVCRYELLFKLPDLRECKRALFYFYCTVACFH